jgi:hypothetical protein
MEAWHLWGHEPAVIKILSGIALTVPEMLYFPEAADRIHRGMMRYRSE